MTVISYYRITKEIELLPFGVTFLCCLFVNMEYGILIGAGIHLLLLAYIGNRPHPELIRLPVSLIS
jgi:sodium-independent sulfate anion transporter 11